MGKLEFRLKYGIQKLILKKELWKGKITAYHRSMQIKLIRKSMDVDKNYGCTKALALAKVMIIFCLIFGFDKLFLLALINYCFALLKI